MKQDHRRGQRQGRRGQVLGGGESGPGPESTGGHKVGLLDADVYGPSVPTMLGIDEAARGHRGQEDHPGHVPRPAGHQHGPADAAGPAGDLARSPGLLGGQAVPEGRAVERSGLPGRGHAARHGRRPADPGPAGAPVRRGHGDHAPGSGPGRRAPRHPRCSARSRCRCWASWRT